MFVATKYCCCYKTFVATNTPLLRQKFCHDWHTFITAKDPFVMTKVLSRQNLCLSQQNFCHDKNVFVATSILLSRQKTCFVATKIILVATPANDTVCFSCPAVEAESKIMFEYVEKGFACRSIPATTVCGLVCLRWLCESTRDVTDKTHVICMS